MWSRHVELPIRENPDDQDLEAISHLKLFVESSWAPENRVRCSLLHLATLIATPLLSHRTLVRCSYIHHFLYPATLGETGPV